MTHEPYEPPRPYRAEDAAPDAARSDQPQPTGTPEPEAYSAPPETRSPWTYHPGPAAPSQPTGATPWVSQPYGTPYQSYGTSYQPYGGQPYGSQSYGAYTGYPGYYAPTGAVAAPDPSRPTARRGLLAGLLALVVAAAVVVAGVGFATSGSSTIAGSGSAAQLPQALDPNGSGSGGSGSSGNGGSLPNGGSTPSGSKTAATAAQKVGVVTIVSTLTYQQAESAGTGTILSSDGLILTNNHVVNGATGITVTVESTDRTYKADVVGTAPTKDIAVLKLRNASGLTTANYAGTASGVKVGDAVTGVGNAGGTGSLTAASGKVTALNQSITATDENGQDAETLHQLIQVDAPIISGDSGGPLYDSSGKVIGVDTAASASSRTSAAGASTAYAITIDNAMSIARQIESGVRTTTIHIGLPGFLGVSTAQANGTQGSAGVAVQSVVQGGPADQAGITRGSTITAVDGSSVSSPTALRTTLSAKKPGTKVRITWTDANGASHSASATLTTGPAD